MSFLEPAFLIGMLAALGPLIVHLINRKKAVRQDFPALKFLLQSNKRVARGAKIRQLLLLALRMLVVGLLAFALSKPFMSSESGFSAEERLPTATVLVVDISYSMGNADWWKTAMKAAETEVDRLRPWDEVAIVLADEALIAPVNRLTTDHAKVADVLDDLQPGFGRSELPKALRMAEDILSPSLLPNKRIVLISDFSRGGFPKSAAGATPLNAPVTQINVGDDDRGSLAISSIAYEQEGTRREPVFRVDATITNYGAVDRKAVEVRLLVDGSVVAASKIDVLAGKSTSQTFRHRVEGVQARAGSVELVGADSLAADDIRWFTFKGGDRIRALLVNGEPSSVVYRDELFFLERALNPKKAAEGVATTTITREGLEGRDLREFDVVILANVTSVTANAAEALKVFVEGGGGLLLAMGDQVDIPAWNTLFADLLPKPIRGMKQLAEVGDPDAPVKITRYGTTRREHPIFEVFEAPGGSTLQSGQVYSYMLLEPSPPEQSQTLLSFKDAAPALLERKVGRGRVLLYTTTLDIDWSDLATRTAYLPLVRRVVQYLARRATSEEDPDYMVGKPVSLDVEGLIAERAIVVSGEVRTVLEPENGKVTFTPSIPGVWQVWADATDATGTRLDTLDFAVNVDVAESDLTALPVDALSPWLGSASDGASSAATSEKRVNLWPFFLFMVTIGLLIESVLGTRRSVLVRLWRIITRREVADLSTDESNTAS
jgi:hypothetical protein